MVMAARQRESAAPTEDCANGSGHGTWHAKYGRGSCFGMSPVLYLCPKTTTCLCASAAGEPMPWQQAVGPYFCRCMSMLPEMEKSGKMHADSAHMSLRMRRFHQRGLPGCYVLKVSVPASAEIGLSHPKVSGGAILLSVAIHAVRRYSLSAFSWTIMPICHCCSPSQASMRLPAFMWRLC